MARLSQVGRTLRGTMCKTISRGARIGGSVLVCASAMFSLNRKKPKVKQESSVTLTQALRA